MTVNQQLEAYVENTRARFEDLLGQMVEIPSISMDPAKANDMRRMAILAGAWTRACRSSAGT